MKRAQWLEVVLKSLAEVLCLADIHDPAVRVAEAINAWLSGNRPSRGAIVGRIGHDLSLGRGRRGQLRLCPLCFKKFRKENAGVAVGILPDFLGRPFGHDKTSP